MDKLHLNSFSWGIVFSVVILVVFTNFTSIVDCRIWEEPIKRPENATIEQQRDYLRHLAYGKRKLTIRFI